MPKCYGGLACTFFEVVFSVLLSVYADHYQIEKSDITLKEYRDYCQEVFKWLKSCFVDDNEKINEVQQRIKKEISDAEEKRKASDQRLDKWTQTLVIPVILAILGTVIAGQGNILAVLSNSMIVLFVFFLLYGIVVGVRSFVMMLQYSEIEKKKDFARILQGIIDIIYTFPENKE